MKIIKYYNADAIENGGGSNEIIETAAQEQPTQGVNIAALMAKEGVKNSTTEMVAKPIQIGRTEEETKVTDTSTPAATANEEVKAEEVKTEVKPTTPTEEVKAIVPEVQKEQEQKATTIQWQEVIKQQQPKAVFEALGVDAKIIDLVADLKELDPKMVGLLNAYKEGKLVEYSKEMTANYADMPSTDVMRHQLKEEYPKANAKQLDILYEQKVIEAYNLDSDDPDLVERGQLLLDAEADRYRDKLVAKQEQYLLPKWSEKPKEEVINPEVEEQKALVASVTKQFKEDAFTQNILSTNKFSIGEGDEKFNFPVDANELINLAINGDETGELLYEKSVDTNGKAIFKPKAEHQMLLATVNKYGMNFINALIKHGKSLGGKKAIDPIENVKPIDTNSSSQAEAQPKTPAEWMAKNGQLV